MHKHFPLIYTRKTNLDTSFIYLMNLKKKLFINMIKGSLHLLTFL